MIGGGGGGGSSAETESHCRSSDKSQTGELLFCLQREGCWCKEGLYQLHGSLTFLLAPGPPPMTSLCRYLHLQGAQHTMEHRNHQLIGYARNVHGRGIETRPLHESPRVTLRRDVTGIRTRAEEGGGGVSKVNLSCGG